ncbi:MULTISPECIES: formate--tetrahydrofolate ligase [unclassified Gemella]|uniref:formate--tetrahydrofolate ligase n=1 Tax=unclassified Gemella TaxID=2624949 RepID=UPI0015CFB5B3|nr:MULTISPECIES: formate--tetrahydrofolate ligase [unclassified Gemella]MBF0710553.1 formate--tetrahydrofolate ligase [Gemella sp. GL1.1]NYS27897.1 formate--tetrahydrofolate ligase [Gemella sp. GL1]
MKTDFQISQESQKEKITIIANKIGIKDEDLILYGDYKAKIKINELEANPNSNLILVTAVNPTAGGEGKSTVTIGLTEGLNAIGKKACVALREPSLGPVLGMKGGACGGGYSQVIPMDEINLHFTGDMHAITTANNAIAAVIDNHIFQGNQLDIKNVVFNRVLDMNDRALRHIEVATANNGEQRSDHFDITVASEIMAILCLSENVQDLKNKVSNIIVAYNSKGEAIYVRDLEIEGVIAAILKDAIKPNIVQTLENNPAIIHGGPFANIAHGCNSIIATKTAMKYADYVVTEAGFGADLGAEKFFNIKCRKANLKPKAAVIVATIRALKLHGGIEVEKLTIENLEALKIGISNLEKHLENLEKFNVPVVVALNVFSTDTEVELNFMKEWAKDKDITLSETKVFSEGGKGAIDLANKVIDLVDNSTKEFKFLYEDSKSILEKIEIVCKEIYGAAGISVSQESLNEIKKINKLGLSHLPICMAKTPLSLSDDPNLKGRPIDFTVKITDIKLKAGAGFVVVYTNKILTMPGLPKIPNAVKIDIDENENIVNIF